jgi:phage repressor protein C with HTH and peptisase S24 domain
MRFSDYLHLRIEQLGLKMADVVRATGSSKGTVSLWFSGDTTPSLKFVPKLASVLDIDGAELARAIEQNRAPRETKRDGVKGRDYALIPLFENYVNGGVDPGYKLKAAPDFMRHLYFRRDWLEYEGLEADHLVVWMVYGKSMAPQLNEGDVILIDRRINTLDKIESGKIYALTYQSIPIVKRIKIKEFGGYILSSDNPSDEYPPIQATAEEITIQGAIVWRGGHLL